MAKLKRSAHRLFLNTAGSSAAKWNWIGKDIDELSVEMNGSFETKTNIRDETSTTDTGYQPSVETTPYYADPDDPNYEFLEDLALGRKSGDACKAEYMEVIVKDTEDTNHLAYKEDCQIEISSYGGDTSGYQITFVIHPSGNRKKGYVTISAGEPTFTEGEIPGES